MSLDREQLALALEAERFRALRSEAQAGLRERARVARENVLRGDAAAYRAARARVLPLVPDLVVEDDTVPEGVVIND
jgi:hypothetical protein